MRDIVMNVPVMLMLTLGAYLLGVWCRRKSGLSLLHPLLVCVPVIIAILVVFDIPYSYYSESTEIISFLLGPSVVALGLKLYDNRKIVLENLPGIATAVIAGSVTGILSVIAAGKLFDMPSGMILSLEPKSVTTPIAMDIVQSLGGSTSLVAVTVVLSGFVGNLLGPKTLDLLRVKNPISRGAAFGCASHGLGTAKAIEEGALEGAVSGLCIALMGVVTAVLVPIVSMIITV